MDYILWFYDQTIRPIWDEFAPYVTFDQNEINARTFWHIDKDKILNGFGVPPEHRSTSLPFRLDELPPRIWRRFVLDVHGIRTLERYLEVREEAKRAGIDRRMLISSDGFGDKWLSSYKELEKLSHQVYQDGNDIQGNNWFRAEAGYDFNKLDYKAMNIVMAELDRVI